MDAGIHMQETTYVVEVVKDGVVQARDLFPEELARRISKTLQEEIIKRGDTASVVIRPFENKENN